MVEEVSTRDERSLVYAGVLVQELGLEDALAGRSQEEQFLVMLHALEERGVTMEEVQSWIDTCDPSDRPAYEPERCFREKAETALRRPPSITKIVALSGLLAFGVTLGAARLLQRT